MVLLINIFCIPSGKGTLKYRKIMFIVYTFIYIVALIFLFPFEYLKRPKELRGKWLREKFGLFNFGNIKDGHQGIIWVHAVSVGEVIASIPLLEKLMSQYPRKRIILSTITDTGQKVARERAPEGVQIGYLPFDLAFIIRNVLKKIKPELLIVIETELWPNLLRVFSQMRIPVFLVNGRISEKSFAGYKKISFFMKNVLSFVDFFGMQSEEYAQRIKSLGVAEKKIQVIENFKFDSRPVTQIPEWTTKIQGTVIIAGSTHEGEEEFITSIYLVLKKTFPHLNLILAPRHPERFHGVEEMLRAKGLSFLKRSDMSTVNAHHTRLHGVIILLDTIGELAAIYSISDIAIIGKSFRGYGGQNPLEPASWGKTIICGPHMENFPVIQEFIKAGAALEVTESDLFSALEDLLATPEKAKEIGLKAQQIYMKNSGAVERTVDVIARYITEHKGIN